MSKCGCDEWLIGAGTDALAATQVFDKEGLQAEFGWELGVREAGEWVWFFRFWDFEFCKLSFGSFDGWFLDSRGEIDKNEV